MSLSNKAILEISELSSRAENLSRGSASERTQSTVLLQRISNIRQIGLSSDEMRSLYASALLEEVDPQHKKSDAAYRATFDRYLAGKADDTEFRDFFAGTQSLVYTQGAAGGYFIPQEYDVHVREAMAQVDPILDPDVTDFTMTDSPTLRPEIISGWNLSTAVASLVGETIQANPQTIPTVVGGQLRADKIFKVSFASTIEASEDIPGFGAKVVRAGSVALARRIGRSVISGRGGADISGLTTTLTSSANNATQGKLALGDLTTIFFGVDRWYRAAKKCAWLMNDGVYRFLRNAVDSQNRPLLSVERDTEMLFGKPVYVTPSLATLYSSIGLQGCIIFGDLSSIVVRASRVTIQRHRELSQVDITRGEQLWIARARCDAAYFDVSGGANPPLILATVN